MTLAFQLLLSLLMKLHTSELKQKTSWSNLYTPLLSNIAVYNSQGHLSLKNRKVQIKRQLLNLRRLNITLRQQKLCSLNLNSEGQFDQFCPLSKSFDIAVQEARECHPLPNFEKGIQSAMLNFQQLFILSSNAF